MLYSYYDKNLTLQYINTIFLGIILNRSRFMRMIYCCFLSIIYDFMSRVTLLLDQPTYLQECVSFGRIVLWSILTCIFISLVVIVIYTTACITLPGHRLCHIVILSVAEWSKAPIFVSRLLDSHR